MDKSLFTRLPVIDGHSPALSSFQIPNTNSAVKGSSYVAVRPLTNLLGTASVLEFAYPGSTKYIDLSKTQLYVKVRIVDTTGNKIKKDANVGIANNGLSTIFSNVELQLNNVPVARLANNLYPIKSYVECITKNMESSMASYMPSRLFAKDTAGHMEDCNIPAAPGQAGSGGLNSGFNARASVTKLSAPVEMMGNLHLDVLSIERYLLSNISLGFKFYQADDSFRLMSSDSRPDYKLEIMEAILYIFTVDLCSEIIIAQEKVLANSPAVYPFWSSHFRTYSVSKGDTNMTVDAPFGSRIPSKLFIVMIASQAFNGKYDSNPYNLQTFGLNRVSLTINGANVPYGKLMSPNFSEALYQELYLAFMSAAGHHMHPRLGLEVSYEEFSKGYCVIGADIDSHPFGELSYIPLEAEGMLTVDLGFDKPLPQSVNVIIIGHLVSCLRVDSSRNVVIV